MAEREEFIGRSVAELMGRGAELRKEIFDLRMKLAADPTAQKRYRAARKDLARLMTARRAAELKEGASR